MIKLRLDWDDLITEETHTLTTFLPVAVGRDLAYLPSDLEGQVVYHVVIPNSTSQVSRCHALIYIDSNQVILEDLSTNGTIVNQKKIIKKRSSLVSGDSIRFGRQSFNVTLLNSEEATVEQPVTNISTTVFYPSSEIIAADQTQAPQEYPATIIFNPETDDIEEYSERSSVQNSSFPPSYIFSLERVSLSSLSSSGFPIEECDYAALGGGIGSFVWVDGLRIGGVKSDAIKVLSLQRDPYSRYETLLRNCQIPRYKRIRSGSDSCPDNLWGWPGYALREAWEKIFSGQLFSGLYHLWQVFSEPILADTYTPISDNVFKSMDREAKRIGWNHMINYASIRSIRKTEDDRYVIAYSATKPPGKPIYKFLIAKYAQICTGYPAIKLLDDLREYRDRYPDSKTVFHGYEPHDQVYDYLEQKGGTVLIRGFGIVASQILDRLYKARKQNPNIVVVHLSRSPKPGHKFGMARRSVENHWEFQPYNWPKGTWGGDMRSMLEAADPLRRRELLESWGGTTTASRTPWREAISEGLTEGWYITKFGQVDKIECSTSRKPVTHIRSRGINAVEAIEADFIIDCTGLVSDPREHPVLNDLVNHYNLDLNPQSRLHVENDFEVRKMRNGRGRMYAAGIITLGGPYAPVDTFLGLQYAAHRSVESLARTRSSKVKYTVGIRSLLQWIKWALNKEP